MLGIETDLSCTHRSHVRNVINNYCYQKIVDFVDGGQRRRLAPEVMLEVKLKFQVMREVPGVCAGLPVLVNMRVQPYAHDVWLAS